MSVTIKRERRTYEPDGQESWLRDTIRAGVFHDDDAKARLAAHKHEMEVDAAAQTETKAPADLSFERRINPNVTAGTGGEFAPPAWYPSLYAGVQQPGRPFGDLLPNIHLPKGVAQINVPRIITGTVEGQAADGGPVPGGDPTTSDTSSAVCTIAGALIISQQLVDLTPGGFDALIWPELQKTYNAELESQLLAGPGNNGQLLGLSNVTIPAANSVSGTSATTVTLLWPLLGKAFANVGNNRNQPPEVWLMAIRRWGWIASSLDDQHRPIAAPGNVPDRTDTNGAGGALPVGPILGLPVYMDGAITGGTSADNAYCVRPSDSFLFEGTPTVQATPEPTAGTLQVRLIYRNYVAAVLNRYPAGIGMVTAMPQPSGF